jgi:hypothetical protein
MKAQRDVAEDPAKEGPAPALSSATNLLLISVTFDPESKNSAAGNQLPQSNIEGWLGPGPH